MSWFVGALSIGLLTAGAVAPYVGRAIGERGGRPVLAAGQLSLGISPNLPVFVFGRTVLGAGMTAGLYDAALMLLAVINLALGTSL